MSVTHEPWLSVACRPGGDHHCRSTICECRRCHGREIAMRRIRDAKTEEEAYQAAIDGGLDDAGARRVANAWKLVQNMNAPLVNRRPHRSPRGFSVAVE